MSQKVAVFTCSDIQSTLGTVRHFVKNPTRIQTVEVNGKKQDYASYGRLEKAIAEGYNVYVMTTRKPQDLGPQDEWWVNLVGRENVRFIHWLDTILGLECVPDALTWQDLYWGLKKQGIKIGQDFA